MSLGKRIYQYRTESSMSQGDLAEQLGVSRQSISKWETDSSVPDLDKLVKLSQVFGVTLDELVMGETNRETVSPPPVQPQQVVVIQREKTPNRVTAAWVFFGLAAFLVLGIALAVGSFGGIFYGIPFVILGLICLFVRKHTVLTCVWTLILMVDAFLAYVTGIRTALVFHTFIYQKEWNYVRLIMAWVMLVVWLLLIAFTAKTVSKGEFVPNKKNELTLLGGWAIYLLLHVSLPLNSLAYFISILLFWVRVWLLSLLLGRSAAWLRQKTKKST